MRRLFPLVAAVFALAAGPVRGAPPLRVAVVEFQNGGGGGPEADALGKGLQSMITTDLSQVGAFQLIERSRLVDIQAELNLGRSGLVDPKTAARIGRLLGATHLVAGTFTVVGRRMRLDTRLFGVADGRILLAEATEGERDAFFELEKDLVKRVIQAAGVTLAPKERAEVARIHTADFEAFQKFSEGVKLFDEKKYEEAVAALRDAERRDGNFRLAAVTLGEYERIITELRSKADNITRSEEEVRALEQNREVADFVAMIGKLEAIAARPGPAAMASSGWRRSRRSKAITTHRSRTTTAATTSSTRTTSRCGALILILRETGLRGRITCTGDQFTCTGETANSCTRDRITCTGDRARGIVVGRTDHVTEVGSRGWAGVATSHIPGGWARGSPVGTATLPRWWEPWELRSLPTGVTGAAPDSLRGTHCVFRPWRAVRSDHRAHFVDRA